MAKLIDLSGAKFGRWTVLSRAKSNRNGREKSRACWLSQCSCGVKRVVTGRDLRKGNTTSCGCLKLEKAVDRLTVHGHNKRNGRSGTYHSWVSMKTRCDNPNRNSWQNYGGAGIAYCARWASFDNFLADMGERPYGMSLDRINPYGNYEPENCRWATRQQQNTNTRKHYDAAHR